MCAEVVSFILNLELFFSSEVRYLVAMKSRAKLGAILRQHRHTMREGAPVLEVRLATCIHMGKEGGKGVQFSLAPSLPFFPERSVLLS